MNENSTKKASSTFISLDNPVVRSTSALLMSEFDSLSRQDSYIADLKSLLTTMKQDLKDAQERLRQLHYMANSKDQSSDLEVITFSLENHVYQLECWIKYHEKDASRIPISTFERIAQKIVQMWSNLPGGLSTLTTKKRGSLSGSGSTYFARAIPLRASGSSRIGLASLLPSLGLQNELSNSCSISSSSSSSLIKRAFSGEMECETNNGILISATFANRKPNHRVNPKNAKRSNSINEKQGPLPTPSVSSRNSRHRSSSHRKKLPTANLETAIDSDEQQTNKFTNRAVDCAINSKMDVHNEIKLLIQEITRLGQRDPADNKIKVPFGVLVNDEKCSNIFEALVGTLRAAKKKKVITFQGELLLQGVHDKVPVILLEENIRVIGAHDLPVMDRNSELTDAFVEVKLSNFESVKTQVCRKTLQPTWNEDFRFELSNEIDLLGETLEFKVWDYDVYSANNIVGTVTIDLNPLVGTKTGQISGSFPIYDTLRGVRGELIVAVKLQFFGDKFGRKDSALGVNFFSCPLIPHGHRTTMMIGLVDVLETEDDPEFHWADNFRSPRTSNEARQKILYSLTGKIRQKIAKKVIEMGGNAVIGFLQSFDLERHSITARAIGSACRILIDEESSTKQRSPLASPRLNQLELSPTFAHLSLDEAILDRPMEPMPFHERKVMKLPELLFLTIKQFPVGAVVSIGGVVSAKSIKLITTEKQEDRESWWTELRNELKAHARTLGCPHVVGYTEKACISHDLCVLSATGTAVVLDLPAMSLIETAEEKKKFQGCSIVHVPHSSQFTRMSPCNSCGRLNVPEVLLSTTEPPEELVLSGSGLMVTAVVSRNKKKAEGEANAAAIGEMIPFVEYEIHKQLMYKLRLYGMNAIFGLRMQLSLGDTLLSATATGTAFYVPSMPLMSPFKFEVSTDPAISKLQEHVSNISKGNRKESNPAVPMTEDAGSIEERFEDNQRSKVLVLVDEEVDEETLTTLLDPDIPNGIECCNVESIPLAWCSCFPDTFMHEQLFVLVKNCELDSVQPNRQLSAFLNDLLYELFYNILSYPSVLLTGVSFDVQHHCDNEVRIRLNALAMGPKHSTMGLSLIESSSYTPFQSPMFVRKVTSHGDTPTTTTPQPDPVPDFPDPVNVIITPLSFLAGAKSLRYLGTLSLHFIKEDSFESGGMGMFIHTFLMEIHAILKAHVLGVGGNALVSYRVNQNNYDEMVKNQAYGLVSVSGDIVYGELDTQYKEEWKGLILQCSR